MGGMNGGREVGRCGDGIWSVWDVFWGVAIALGKGEEEARFEVSQDAGSHALKGKLTSLLSIQHRDLHLGNICIRSAAHPVVRSLSPDTTCSSPTELTTRALDPNRRLGFTDLETTIIDYTLSRANMRCKPSASRDGTERAEEEDVDEDSVAFLDLEADPDLFRGDGDEDYQYDIYRL